MNRNKVFNGNYITWGAWGSPLPSKVHTPSRILYPVITVAEMVTGNIMYRCCK